MPSRCRSGSSRPGAPEPTDPLHRRDTAELVVVGGGFTGLWTALLAKERDPARDVVLLEAESIGWAASGRNGGFCSASLTHGRANGLARFSGRDGRRWSDLGGANLDEIEATVERYGIDCGLRPYRRTERRHRAAGSWPSCVELEAAAAATSCSTRTEVRAEVNSPTYLGGVWDRDGCAMLDPARLAWGLRDVCRKLGVRIYDGTPGPADHPDRARPAPPHTTVHCGRLGRRAGHRGPRTPAAPLAPVRRAGLRLRADDRTALGRTVGHARLGQPAGRRRRRATSSTTTG